MRRFKWIEWNLRKIDDHGLSAAEVEGAFDRVLSLRERRDGSFEMFAPTAGGAGGFGLFGDTTGRTMKFPASSWMRRTTRRYS